MVLLVTRVRAEAQGYELAHVAPEGGGMGGAGGVETVNKNTLRTNACLAYDTALGAALAASGCCRTKLLVTGPWEWLLAQFAATFGVRHFYCLLAHLRWASKHRTVGVPAHRVRWPPSGTPAVPYHMPWLHCAAILLPAHSRD